MPHIYAAQNSTIGESAVELNLISAGQYLVKIGRAASVERRVLSINRKLAYLGFTNWNFVCLKGCTFLDYKEEEKRIHKILKDYRLNEYQRYRLTEFFGVKKTGFELFTGGKDMIDIIRSHLTTKASSRIVDKGIIKYVQDDFERHSRPPYQNVFKNQTRDHAVRLGLPGAAIYSVTENFQRRNGD